MLSSQQNKRYVRQLILPGFGEEGQRKLLGSSVLIVGAGGLGSPAAIYLAAAGVGRIGIVDDDAVDLSNLHRQILHATMDTGHPKILSARRTLHALNPEVKIETHAVRMDKDNARDLIREYDLVVSAVDNFPTRYVINDAAAAEDRRIVHGAIFHYEGQITVFDPAAGPCYRCLFPFPPSEQACAEKGLLGVLPGVIGTMQATEAINILAGIGECLTGRMICYEALSMRFRSLALKRRPECGFCGGKTLV